MKGVFCIEGFWYGDHRDSTSVYPILDLVKRFSKMPFLHHRCATKEEFIFCIKRWKTKSFHRNYPLLYLAFHGETERICINSKESVTLDELAEHLGDKCNRVVIYFGSCSTVKTDRRRLQKFMEATKSVAVLGYKQQVDWLQSAAFEIQLLSHLQQHPFDSKGVLKIYDEVYRDCRPQIKALDFRMIANDRIKFPRRRK